MDKTNQVELLEELLKVPLPDSYKDFLLNRGHALINGLPVLGLPLSPKPSSAWGATELIYTARPDLPEGLVAIRLLDHRALCLDLRNKELTRDAPLVEVDLDSEVEPVNVHESFQRYIQEGERIKSHINKSLKHLKSRIKSSSISQFDHVKGGGFPRAHHWRTLRSCVHDQVVGLTALRYKPEVSGLLIDVFLSSDHPDYEEGHGARALALLILADAYKCGGRMNLVFTKNVQGGKIPDELVKLALEYGITFESTSQDRVTHREAVELFAALVDLPQEIREVVNRHEGNGLTLEGLSFVVASGLWSAEEATWLLQNCPRVEKLFMGFDLPENRIHYLETLSYGRAALAVTRLLQRIINIQQKMLREDEVEPGFQMVTEGEFFLLSFDREYRLPWMDQQKAPLISPEKKLLILPRPRWNNGFVLQDLQADLGKLERYSGYACIKTLLYSSEVKFETPVQDNDAYMLQIPFPCRELDEEVGTRIQRARMVRI